MNFAQAEWLLPLAIAVHLLEEIIWLPAWSLTAGSWHTPVSRPEFGFACAVVLVLAVLVTWLSVIAGRESLAAYLAAGLAVVMLLNLFVPHLGAALQLRTYAPGLLTSAAVVAPVTLSLLQQAFALGYVSPLRFVIAAVASVSVAAVVWPRLFDLGRRLTGRAG